MDEASDTTTDGMDDSLRVLFLPENPYDSSTAREIFAEYDAAVRPVESTSELLAEARRGAGCVVVVEEVLEAGDFNRLLAFLEDQPEWSDLPIIVVTRGDRSSEMARRLTERAHATLVERPVQITTLLSMVRSAVRDRRRQYEIRRSIANRNRFLAMVGHELRNPLTSILLAIRQLENTVDSRSVDVIRRQSRNIERIVSDLSDLSRVSRGDLSFDRERIDLADIASQNVEAFDEIAAAEDLELHSQVPDKPLWICGDPVRLDQVIGNLLSNAVRYTPEGGRIEVNVRRSDDRAAVTVSDTGAGIPPEMLDDIFEVFSRGRRKSGDSKEGLGLGLSLAHGIVEEHDGELVAESEGEDKGSQFTVLLPLDDEKSNHSPAPSSIQS